MSRARHVEQRDAIVSEGVDPYRPQSAAMASGLASHVCEMITVSMKNFSLQI